MNNILKNGYVAPYIVFNFANGSLADYLVGKYFLRFHQTRDVDQACSFELELVYVPGFDGETVAMNIHQMILASVGKPVTYQYGYITPNSAVPLIQDQVYKGIFTQYKEDLNQGYMTYTISGVSKVANDLTTQVSIREYLQSKRNKGYIQPSVLVEELCTIENQSTQSVYDIMRYYDCNIQKVDEVVDSKVVCDGVQDGTIYSIFAGNRNASGAKSVGGFVYYSYKYKDHQSGYTISSNAVQGNAVATEEFNKATGINVSQKQPFMCYFDNTVEAHNSNKWGTFHYRPLTKSDVDDNFVYEYGNSYLESDVISFNVSADCIIAMANVAGINGKDYENITPYGENAGTTLNSISPSDFVPVTYNTASGFDEAKWFTVSTLSKLLNFPFEATMTVIGQLKCNHLLDKIHVTVMMNGTIHPLMTGDYIIMGIEDSLSDSGFETTFKLFKQSDDLTGDTLEALQTKYKETYSNTKTMIQNETEWFKNG